jgi:hypothetical protein
MSNDITIKLTVSDQLLAKLAYMIGGNCTTLRSYRSFATTSGSTKREGKGRF